MGVYIDQYTDKTSLPALEKAKIIARVCERELEFFPPSLDVVPSDCVLVSVAHNGHFEAALICDTEYDRNRIGMSIERGEPRPMRYFILKRIIAIMMASQTLTSEEK